MNGDTTALPIEGTDVMMLHFEAADAPFHTLKIAVLDTADRGRPVTLDEIAAVAPGYLGVTPRLTQRVERRADRRWHWVDDPTFDIHEHLDERTVDGTDGLDALSGELAARHLDWSKPLWLLTLVHGLPGGQQAVVVQVHHAIMDGSAAMNVFAALTHEEQGTAATPQQRPAGRIPEQRDPLGRRLGEVAKSAVEVQKRTREYKPDKSVPRAIMKRSRFNRNAGATRVCATRTVPLAPLKELARLTGTNTNGALHATLTQALRDYLLAKGDVPRKPLIANFGVTADLDPSRYHGNRLATARVWMHVEDSDPLSIAARTGRSCTEAVALRKHRGFELQLQAAEFAKIIPWFRERLGAYVPFTPVHLMTAYVAGPKQARWFGDVKAVGLASHAIVVSPANLSITAYTYAGNLHLGALSTPENMPDPADFLRRYEDALETMLTLARTTRPQDGPPVSPYPETASRSETAASIRPRNIRGSGIARGATIKPSDIVPS